MARTKTVPRNTGRFDSRTSSDDKHDADWSPRQEPRRRYERRQKGEKPRFHHVSHGKKRRRSVADIYEPCFRFNARNSADVLFCNGTCDAGECHQLEELRYDAHVLEARLAWAPPKVLEKEGLTWVAELWSTIQQIASIEMTCALFEGLRTPGRATKAARLGEPAIAPADTTDNDDLDNLRRQAEETRGQRGRSVPGGKGKQSMEDCEIGAVDADMEFDNSAHANLASSSNANLKQAKLAQAVGVKVEAH